MISRTSPSRAGEPTFDESITIRSPLRASAGPLAGVAFFVAGFFPAFLVAAGFFFATGFFAVEVFFPGFVPTAFFFGGTVDLLSSPGCRGVRTNLTARARVPQTAGPD